MCGEVFQDEMKFWWGIVLFAVAATNVVKIGTCQKFPVILFYIFIFASTQNAVGKKHEDQ